uniref:Uncharacterized protein LOC111102840 n=1 Tax=Crassostrea virginica TaxID=6565 RepID=A0A8B8ALH2_CRAVI|nr:uncharacterized protein LOC111102840 [Crassostrea virginica]
MEVLQGIFEGNGYTLNIHREEDYKSFYSCVYAAKHGSDQPVKSRNARQMRSDITELEKKNPMYFHLFLPKHVVCDGDHSPEVCLKRDLDKIVKEKKPPTPRECFAAADLLKRCIYIVRYNNTVQGNLKKVRGYIFAPIDKNCPDIEPICILMLEKQSGSLQFANIHCNGDAKRKLITSLGVCMNKEHSHCYGLRFANRFDFLFESSISYGKDENEKDLFRRLSIEFYDTEEQNERILNIICNVELEADNVDLFCKLANNSVTDETTLDDKKKMLKDHVDEVRNMKKTPGECELYALSSVYNVDIIVKYEEWQTFMSVVCTYATCFDSPIILYSGDMEGKWVYTPHITHSDSCSCRQKIPEIEGHIGKIKANILETVLQNPCCPPENKHPNSNEQPNHNERPNHTHLKHLPHIRKTWPELDRYAISTCTDDIAVVMERLKEESRRLDQIQGGRGTLVKAIAKELYGNENQIFVSDLQNALGAEELDLQNTLLNLSKWLKVPIYLYTGVANDSSERHQDWEKYEPTDNPLPSTNSGCRFYITLFHNRIVDSFDRIVPLQGCNCQIPPPHSLLKKSDSTDRQVYKKDVNILERHHPLIKYLTDEPNIDMFEKECRNFPICSLFSSIKVAEKRKDMSERTFDCVESTRHSLLRCLSKEIFGTGKHFGLLMEELSNELIQNIQQYIPFIGNDIVGAFVDLNGQIGESRKGYEKLAIFIKQRIEDDLPCDDLLLWLACTFLQTPIYVLRVVDTNTSTESFWTEYTSIRVIGWDQKKTQKIFDNKCAQWRRYYITLLDTGYTQYHRIVPQQRECTCYLKIPKVPEHADDCTDDYFSNQACRFMRRIRKIDNQLKDVCVIIDQWLYCNQMLQEKCDKIIFEMENRRKDVNIATITGTSAGIVGAALTGVGLALAPFTAGISTVLSIGGAVLAVSGGTVATGAKITESVLNNNTVDTLKRFQNCYQERLENLNSAMSQLKEEVQKLGDMSKEMQANQNLKASDFANIQSLPGVVRTVKGLLMIPLTVLKVSSRGLLILGAIIGPLTAIVDATLLAFSAHNMAKGNKTDVTEDLRRLSASLYGSRRLMHGWAYGNQKTFTYT